MMSMKIDLAGSNSNERWVYIKAFDCDEIKKHS